MKLWTLFGIAKGTWRIRRELNANISLLHDISHAFQVRYFIQETNIGINLHL